MKKVLIGLTLANAIAATMTTASVQATELSSTISFTNDYRFRGLSQTAGDAAVQGSMDLAFENGVYVGIWGSNVDFGDDANLEVDYYIGYGADINDDISYDVSLTYYTYPGYDADDIDYLEFIGALNYRDFTFTYAYSNDYVNSGDDGSYIAVDYSYSLTEILSLDLHAGHSFGDVWDDYGYEDYSIGLSASIAGLDLSVAYLDNNLDVSETDDFDDSTVVFTVSRTF